MMTSIGFISLQFEGFEVILKLILVAVLVPGITWARKCDYASGVTDEESGEIMCAKDSGFCYSFFKLSNDTEGGGSPTFLRQGCWEASPKSSCQHDSCIATDMRADKSLFCCCSADNCNSNVSYIQGEDEDEAFHSFSERMGFNHDDTSNEHKPFLNEAVVGVFITMTFLLCVAFILLVLVWKRRLARMRGGVKESVLQMDCEAGEKLMEPISKINWEVTDPVVLGEEIAKGKFATVCTGRSGGAKVALKVFPLEHREYFENEKYIFQCLGESIHDNILKYRGWQEFTVNSSTNLILVLDRISPGNLRDYLSCEDTSLSMPQTLKILKGLASGLSFLHGENQDSIVIAHRDLTSKNILIDKDLTPYIADFGLSLRTKGSRYYFGGRERQAEFCSLADAGTLRYMAPELLEGAVNLKDLENSLKQADIYALALLIWETINRSPIALNCCHVLPYSPELGKDISIEALTRLVVTRRGRPSFTNWCDLPISRSIRDTLNETWDAEPDARLTALCVVERLADLATVQLQNNKNANCTTPLECPPESSPWTGRNVCMERNLLEENSDKSTQYLLTTSEKHRVNYFNGGHGSSVGTLESVATTNTDLSNGSSLQPQPPPPIQYLQNIRR